MSHVRCQVSHVRCQVSSVRCQVSGVTYIYIFIYFLQSCGASRWRVCYQRGLPCLVFINIYNKRGLPLVRVQHLPTKFDEAVSWLTASLPDLITFLPRRVHARRCSSVPAGMGDMAMDQQWEEDNSSCLMEVSILNVQCFSTLAQFTISSHLAIQKQSNYFMSILRFTMSFHHPRICRNSRIRSHCWPDEIMKMLKRKHDKKLWMSASEGSLTFCTFR